MKIPNKIPKAIEAYEKEIKRLVHAITLARQDIVKAFSEERKKRRVSLRSTAEQFGVSVGYLHDVERGRRDLTVSMFEKIKKF